MPGNESGDAGNDGEEHRNAGGRRSDERQERGNASFFKNHSIMIHLHVKELMIQRGIKSRLKAMMRGGISQGVAQKYLSGKKQWILLEHIGILCALLRCQPNDLFTWTPDQPADDYPDNPLQAIRQKPAFNLEEKLKGMSLEEIREKFGE